MTAILPIAIAAALSASQTGASRFALTLVVDQRGRAIVDVGADDFVVEEDGGSREVLSVRVADYPVALVIDNGGSAADDFAQMQKAVARFLERLGPRPVAIVTAAGDHPNLVATFSDERSIVTDRLRAIAPTATADGHPDDHLLEGAALAAKNIAATGALFSTVVVLAAPGPDARAAGGATDEANSTTFTGFTAPIIDSRTVLRVIARTGNAASDGGGLDALRRLAPETHGQYTPIYSAASYEPALDRLAARLNTELLVEYLVPVGSKPVDVQLGVRIPGTRAVGLGVAPR